MELGTIRKCKNCGFTGPIYDYKNSRYNFPTAGKHSNGKTYYRLKCKSCFKQVKDSRRDDLRKQYEQYKKADKCTVCGYADHRALQYHHKNPKTKDFSLGESISRRMSWNTIKAELKKCECMCANCHQILHYNERKA